MLSYRHSFHAGNFADVLKHLVQVAILEYLKRKDKPFCYHDTHSGAGLYSLSGEHASKTGEYQSGIGVLFNQAVPTTLEDGPVGRYLRLLHQLNPDGELEFYPGSPSIAAQLLRPQDALQLTELHPTDYGLLSQHLGKRKHCRIEKMDAWAGIKAMLPPLARRGLVLIDPPYELSHEYDDVVKGLQLALQRFATGCYAIWYPVIDRGHIERFVAQVAALPVTDLLRIEWCPKADSTGFGMTGSGMLVINPPYLLAEQCRAMLPWLHHQLGNAGPSQVTQLIAEA
ncbi:23S rRNA (adenine(2030)-N(6))-methyltransferase RlmJ [Alkalimonas amylolytica]|nr:23S rRNA (adenine(2030)-N(6))-methyltransferase RlmJ [Alkalimonas amylolytica]